MSADEKRFVLPIKIPEKVLGTAAWVAVYMLSAILHLVFLSGTVVMPAVLAGYIHEAPPLDPQRFTMVETGYIYDDAGREVAALHGEQNRVYLPLAEIPGYVQEVFIAVEDKRFYEHSGFDCIGSLRAVRANLKSGRITQGASTITQQLVRNLYLLPDQTLERKVQEIWLALNLEQELNKEIILELYLNQIYFGSSAYGVEAAARTYFNKSIHEVHLAEAAMLAGIACAPNRLNPFHSEEDARLRSQIALGAMLEQGLLSEHRYGRAVQYDFEFVSPAQPYPHPYFLDYVIHYELLRVLAARPEIGSVEAAYRTIYTGGLRVYTTLNKALQEHVEAVLNDDSLYPRTVAVDMPLLRESIREGSFSPDRIEAFLDPETGIPQPQAALVLADPASGRVLALAGGRGYRKPGNEVLRYLSYRQPGSAIKPLVVYAPAFEEKVLAGAGVIVEDSPFTAGGWTPRNYDGSYRDKVTVRQALAFSYNIPAARILQQLTPQVGTAYAQRMGITTFAPVDLEILSTALGGITYGVTAYDMAQAYSVLANEGVKNKLHTITRVEDRRGNVLYEYSSSPEQILSPQTVYLVNSILMDVVNYTTATGLRGSRPIAAKTGTTDQARDIYLVAYTPNLVASLWMGYDEPRMGGIPRGWNYSTGIVREVFNLAFEMFPAASFERPPGIVSYTICKVSGRLANEYCTAAETAVTDLFFSTAPPLAVCENHAAPPPAAPPDKPPHNNGPPRESPVDPD